MERKKHDINRRSTPSRRTWNQPRTLLHFRIIFSHTTMRVMFRQEDQQLSVCKLGNCRGRTKRRAQNEQVRVWSVNNAQFRLQHTDRVVIFLRTLSQIRLFRDGGVEQQCALMLHSLDHGHLLDGQEER
jgi:hypothetical protein